MQEAMQLLLHGVKKSFQIHATQKRHITIQHVVQCTQMLKHAPWPFALTQRCTNSAPVVVIEKQYFVVSD